jgi:hypothetical protein
MRGARTVQLFVGYLACHPEQKRRISDHLSPAVPQQ